MNVLKLLFDLLSGTGVFRRGIEYPVETPIILENGEKWYASDEFGGGVSYFSNNDRKVVYPGSADPV